MIINGGKKMFSILYCFLEFIIRFFPSRIGIFLRSHFYYTRNLKIQKPNLALGVQLVSPNDIEMNEGVVVNEMGYFNAYYGKIKIGRNVSFNRNVHINAACGGLIQIGDDSLIGPQVVMRTAQHEYRNPNMLIREQGHVPGDIIIGKDCWIGANVVIMGGVTIGNGSIVGAGAVVSKNIPQMSVAVGVPARVIRSRGES